MKTGTIILFLLLGIYQIFGQDGWKEMELRGKVSALKTTTNRRDGSGQDRTNITQNTYLFNRDGFILSYEKLYKAYYSTEFELEIKETFEYDKMNRMVQKKVYDEDNELDYIYTYAYNRKGKIVKETKQFIPLNRTGFIEYVYDRSGNLIKEIDDGDEEVYKYNKRNQKIEGEADLFGQSLRYFYRYDANGNVSEMKRLANQKPLFKNVYKYDAANRLIEEITYDKNNELFGKDIYKYNTEGKLIDKTVYGIRTVYAYDQYQNCIQENSAKYAYTYDSEENWQQKKTYYEGEAEPAVTDERTISYF